MNNFFSKIQNKNIKKYVFFTCVSLLGFKRGINSYDYKFKKYNLKNKTDNTFEESETYLYSGKICYGLFGIASYINPFFYFILIPKEIYRLEVNIRNLEKEKESDFYNQVI
jgi:hypothetical protein